MVQPTHASTQTEGPLDPRMWGRPAALIVQSYEAQDVSRHPLFADLNAKPVDMRAIWLLVANLQAGISQDFVGWLATTIAHVDDRRVGSLLAKQLTDELGRGDFSAIHSVLLSRFVEALAPWRMAGDDRTLLAPGLLLREKGGQIFHAAGGYQAVGALIAGEIFAEKMDRCLGDQIRRQSALSEHALSWLTLHEVLEADHAQDSGSLSALVPASGPELTETWRGATIFWSALWEFLDGVWAIAQRDRAATAQL